jgi:hypothetical protein
VDLKPSARGWCYILEEHGLAKGDFDKAEGYINECRKSGLLSLDFVAEDDARTADNIEECDPSDPVAYAEALVARLDGWVNFLPVSFWDFQPVYIQMVVEKIDLKTLFLPICRRFRIPLINARGWSDLNMRAALMRRFAEHEAKGRRPVLMACGDHDPSGLQITDRLKPLLHELASAVGWSPENLHVERFGLNADFIRQHHLTWIDGLKTGSGKDLADPTHQHHEHAYVQNYIEQFGARKCEANALIVRPEAGRQLCLTAIEKHLDLNAIAAYEQRLAEERKRVQAAMPEVISHYLSGLTSGSRRR